jgi:hypothetical protein
MASNINPNNIDGTYPVAGVDNDSQGFRSNFTNIKNNFTYAKSEITDLQSKAVLKSALTGTSLDNNFAGALISSAEIKDFRETRYDFGSISGTVTLNHANGHYQTATTSDIISLAFTNWPAAGKLGRIRLDVTVTNITHTMTLPASVTVGIQGIAGFDSATNIITFGETGTYIFEFTTDDAGTTIAINDLTRPRDYFYSDHITLYSRVITDARGQAGDMEGMLVVDTTTPAVWVCTGSYDGTTVIWRKTELESVNNEATLASNVTTTSSSLSTITGMSFVAQPNIRYTFEAYIPFAHSTSSTSTHTFSVNFPTGTCFYTVEQQTAPTSAMSLSSATTSDSTAGVATTASTSSRLCRITGTYIGVAGPASQRTVSIRFATSAGTLTAIAGSYLKFNRV